MLCVLLQLPVFFWTPPWSPGKEHKGQSDGAFRDMNKTDQKGLRSGQACPKWHEVDCSAQPLLSAFWQYRVSKPWNCGFSLLLGSAKVYWMWDNRMDITLQRLHFCAAVWSSLGWHFTSRWGTVIIKGYSWWWRKEMQVRAEREN